MSSFSVAERNLHEGYDVRIALLLLFKLEEIVVRAALGVRELTTNSGTRMVNSAASRFQIEKVTSLPQQRVGFASQHTLLLIHFSEAR